MSDKDATWRRLFGRGGGTPAGPEAVQAAHDRYAARLGLISDFLLSRDIEPTPAHLIVAHRAAVVGEPGLAAEIDALIARDGWFDVTALVDRRDTEGEISADMLHRLVDQAQQSLDQLTWLVQQSSEDARDYGSALATNVADLGKTIAQHPSLVALIELTGTMIEKTKAAEARLRDTGSEMATMQASLTEAISNAETDVLTGLSNRRAFERALGAAAERAAISGAPLSLAFCDIDHFKRINDTYGHAVGDRVLNFVGKLLQKACDGVGEAARHGGEEFVMIFPGLDAGAARDIVEAAREDLAARHIVEQNSRQPIGSISFSAGVAALPPGGNVSNMLRRADLALYRAKRSGRNQVLLADPDPASVNENRPLP